MGAVSPATQSGYPLLPDAHVHRICSRWFYDHVLIVVHVLVGEFSKTSVKVRLSAWIVVNSLWTDCFCTVWPKMCKTYQHIF